MNNVETVWKKSETKCEFEVTRNIVYQIDKLSRFYDKKTIIIIAVFFLFFLTVNKTDSVLVTLLQN